MLNRACALFVVALLALALFGPEQAFAAERCTVLDAASADARQRINDHLCFYSARPGDPAVLPTPAVIGLFQRRPELVRPATAAGGSAAPALRARLGSETDYYYYGCA